MIIDLYAFADPDFFAPLEVCADRDPLLRPARTPQGWTSSRAGLWTRWSPPGALLDDTVPPVYASAAIDRVQQVLDAFSAVCFKHGTAFKHVANQTVYRYLNHEDGSEAHAGKLCAGYPATAEAANELMRSLHSVTADEAGPVVSGGRRYRDSQVLYYGRGADPSRLVLRPDGLRLPASEDGFMDAPGPPTLGMPAGYELIRPVSIGVAGFAAAARRTADGSAVLVRRGARHAGLSDDGRTASDRLRAAWRMLSEVHAAAPGLCPRPVEYIEDATYEYLVCELVPGRPLTMWMAANTPLTDSGSTASDWARYHRRAEHLLARIEEDLRRLWAVGYPTEGVTARDVLVGEGDSVRLTGFVHGRAGEPRSPQAEAETVAVSKLAFLLLSPQTAVAERSADVLPHIHRDLTDRGPVPPALWQKATRFATVASVAAPTVASVTAQRDSGLPSPDDIDGDEHGALAGLRDRVAASILADAVAEDRWRAFPTVPQGYESNTIGVAYGLAGIVHALRRSQTDVPDRITRRLRDEALSQAHELAPGLFVGLAGIAWVLADLGLADEAQTLLAVADRHPLVRESATLAWGAAGVAMAHLAVYGHTGEDQHVERAQELMTLPESAALTDLLGPDDATGLWYGRTGIAHAYQQLAAVTGDRAPWLRGLRLLHAELDRAKPGTGEEIMFPASATDRRGMYYLYCGTAGYLRTACRYLAEEPDERLAAALPKLITKSAGMTHVAHAGLCQGLAGLGFALAESGEALGDARAHAAARKAARALFKHAIPDGAGVRFLGDLRMRYSSDLWSGSSGVLLFLSYLLAPRPDALFTVDLLARPRSGDEQRAELLPLRVSRG